MPSDNMNSLFFKSILHSIVTPYGELDNSWRPHKILVMNIPQNVFNPGPKFWSDIRREARDEQFSTLFFLLAKIVSNKNYGSAKESLYFGDNTIPKVVPVIERLRTQYGLDAGYRLWLFQLDSAFDMGIAVESIIEENVHIQKESKLLNKKFQPYRCYRNIKSIEDYASVLSVYANGLLDATDFDSLHHASNRISAPNSPINPYQVFKPEYSFSVLDENNLAVGFNIEDVCSEQVDLSNYFDVNNGISATTFQRFPFPESTYRYFPEFFEPEKLHRAPLPDVIGKNFIEEFGKLEAEILKAKEVLDTNVRRIGEIETEIGEQAINRIQQEWKTGRIPHGEVETELHFLFEEKCEYIQRITNLNEDASVLPYNNLRKLTNMLTSDDNHIGKMLLSNEQLEKEFARTNEFIAAKPGNIESYRRLQEERRIGLEKLKLPLEELKAKYFPGNAREKYLREKEKLIHCLKSSKGLEEDESDFMNQKFQLKNNITNGRILEYEAEKQKLYDSIYNPKEYPDKIKHLIQHMVKGSWEILMKGKKISPAAYNARQFFIGLPKEKHFVDAPQTCRNLSIFGNMIVGLTRDLDKIKQLDSQFQLTILIYLNVMATYHYVFGNKMTIKPNIFITGDAGVGKSFAIRTAGELCFPGSTSSAVHFTPQAFAVDMNLSDIHFLCEETPLWMLGIRPDGKDMPIDNQLKQRMSAGYTTYQVFDKDEDGKRICKTGTTQFNSSATLCSNVPTGDASNGPLMDRGIKMSTGNRKRTYETESLDVEMTRSFNEMTALNEEVCFVWQLSHFYLFFYEMCITSHAIPFDVDTREAAFNADIVFKHLKSKGVPYPRDRHIAMYAELCRVATIMNAIRSEFFSELGIKHRIDETTGMKKPFKPELMYELIKWCVTTKEISLCVLTMMENTWIPYDKVEIAKVVCNQLNTLKKGKAKFMTVVDKDGISTYDDNRYVVISDNFYPPLYTLIQTQMKNPKSIPDIRATLNDMKADMIESAEKEFYDPLEVPRLKLQYQLQALESDITKFRFDLGSDATSIDNAITLDPNGNSNIGTIGFEDEGDQMVTDYSQSNPSDKEDAIFQLRQMMDQREELQQMIHVATQKENIEKAKRKKAKMSMSTTKNPSAGTKSVDYFFMTRLRDAQQAGQPSTQQEPIKNDTIDEAYMVLMDKIGSEKEKIPCVKMDVDPRDRSKRRICVAVELSNTDFNGAMREAIKKVENMYQKKSCYITGLHYERKDVEPGKKGFVYNLFDVINLDKNENKVISVGNKFRIGEYNQSIYNDIFGVRVSDFDARVASVLDGDSEEIHFMKYWETCELPADESTYIALPDRAQQCAWIVRENHPMYADKKTSIIKNYPKDYLAILDKDKDLVKKMMDENTKKQMIMNKEFLYSDMLQKKRKIGNAEVPMYSPPKMKTKDDWGRMLKFAGISLKGKSPVKKPSAHGNQPRTPVSPRSSSINNRISDPMDITDQIL